MKTKRKTKRKTKFLSPNLTRRALENAGYIIATEVNMCRSPLSNHPLRADFLLTDLAIYVEFDGPQHFEPYIYGDSQHFDLSVRKDYAKAMSTTRTSMRLIRVTSSQTSAELIEFINILESDDSLLGIYCTETSVHEIRNEQDIRRFYRMVAGYDIVEDIDKDEEIDRLRARIHELNSLLDERTDFASELKASCNIKSRSLEIDRGDVLLRYEPEIKPDIFGEQGELHEFINYAIECGILANIKLSRTLMYAMYQDWYVSERKVSRRLLKVRAFYAELDKYMDEMGYTLSTSRARVSALIRSSARSSMVETFYMTPYADETMLEELSPNINQVVNENRMTHYYAKSQPEVYHERALNEFKTLCMNELDDLSMNVNEVMMYQLMIRFDHYNEEHYVIKENVLTHMSTNDYHKAALECCNLN